MELSLQSGCILWGNRVVVPHQGHQQLLQELREGHPGISSMTRLYIWSGLDQDIEQLVQDCHVCQVNSNTPHHRHHFSHGNGQVNHGLVFMWTLQVQYKDTCH